VDTGTVLFAPLFIAEEFIMVGGQKRIKCTAYFWYNW